MYKRFIDIYLQVVIDFAHVFPFEERPVGLKNCLVPPC